MKSRKELLEEKIRKMVREEMMNEYEDKTDSDWYLGNYKDLEDYRKVMLRGILTSANNAIKEIQKTNLRSKTDAMAKCLRYLYKIKYDTVDALPVVLKVYETGKFNPESDM